MLEVNRKQDTKKRKEMLYGKYVLKLILFRNLIILFKII